MNLRKMSIIRNISIPSTTVASTCWFTSLFALCVFSLLYLHPRDASNSINFPKFISSITWVTPSSTSYVSNETIIDDPSGVALLNSSTPTQNVSYVQLSDSTITELGNRSNDTIVELPRTSELNQNELASDGTIITEILVENTTPSNKEATNENVDQDENYDIIPSFDVLSNPPLNCSRAKRINWLIQKLEESKILKSTIRTQNFDGKIQAFLKKQGHNNVTTNNSDNPSCEVRIFLTWISSASLFGNRELLGLESMLKAHPNGCVMILSRTMDSKLGRLLLKPLMVRGYRILPIAPDFHYLFSNTPAQMWLERLESGGGDPGRVPITQNLSNLLRMVVLYKYGGIYLDTDMIILKSLSSLKNSIGVQSVDPETQTWKTLNNAVLIFDKEHPLVWEFMEEFANTFNGFQWGFNGPYLTTRVVNRAINDTKYEFNIMARITFYPIDWKRIPRLFENKFKNDTTWADAKFNEINSKSYGIHLWNKQTRSLKIERQSELGRLISEHCIICKDVYDS